MLPIIPLAEEHITRRNGIALNALVGKHGEFYMIWFEPLYPREEYEYLGNGYKWDDANAFCEHSQKSPSLCSSVSGVNKIIQAENIGSDKVRIKTFGGFLKSQKEGGG